MSGILEQEIKVKVTGDTSGLDNAIRQSLQNLTGSFVNPQSTPNLAQNNQQQEYQNYQEENQKQQSIETTQRLNESAEKTSESFSDIHKTLSLVNNSLLGLNAQLSQLNIPSLKKPHTTEEQRKLRLSQLGDKDKMTLAQSFSAAITQVSQGNGNLLGNALKTGSSLASSAKAAKDLVKNEDLSNILGMVGKFVMPMAIAGLGVQVATQFGSMYKQILPTLDKSLMGYGKSNLSNYSAQENSAYAFNMYKSMIQFNKGTGLSNQEFMEYANSFNKYGVTSSDKAAQNAKYASMFARRTNGDISQIVDLVGTLERYGSTDGIKDLTYAYSQAKASGLTESQTSEFFDGLKRTVEEGISKGFIKSTKDVSDVMVMFSKLSGNNPLWEGKLGFDKYNRLSGGIENATALSNSAQVLTFNAINNAYKDPALKEKFNKILKDSGSYVDGGDYHNTMALINTGLNADIFKAIVERVNSQFQNDQSSQIFFWKQLTGGNDLLANQYYNLSQEYIKNPKKYENTENLEKILESIEVKSDSTKQIEAINDLKVVAEEIGRHVASIETSSLSGISALVSRIANKVAPVTIQGRFDNNPVATTRAAEKVAGYTSKAKTVEEQIKDIEKADATLRSTDPTSRRKVGITWSDAWRDTKNLIPYLEDNSLPKKMLQAHLNTNRMDMTDLDLMTSGFTTEKNGDKYKELSTIAEFLITRKLQEVSAVYNEAYQPKTEGMLWWKKETEKEGYISREEESKINKVLSELVAMLAEIKANGFEIKETN